MAKPADVLCCGIVVADHVCTPIDHVPAAGELVMSERMLLTIGGCAANAAVDLVKMGDTAAVVGRVGSDIFGRIVGDLLREHGVDVSNLTVSTTADTSQTLIVNVKGEDRRFVHTFGANGEFSAADIAAPLTPALSPKGRTVGDGSMDCKVLYVGGYLLMAKLVQDELAPVFEAARRRGAKTVLDVATPGKADYLSRLEKLLPHVDVFLPNNHEAELITGEHDPVKQAERFQRLGAGTVVITMGGDGVVLVNDRVRLRCGIYPIDYVDASGGGDAFDAGYIHGLLHNLEVEDCLRVASALGASCVRAIGTTPGVFTRQECEDFIRKHPLKIERI